MTGAPTSISSKTAAADVVLRAVADALQRGEPAVLVTVLSRTGSTPATPGQKLALLGSGEAIGTIGGGALEQDILGQMQVALAAGRQDPARQTLDLRAAYGMSCGGSVEVLIETLDAGRTVLVVGAGHVGSALAPLLATVAFRVVVCDSRPALVEGGVLEPSARLRLLVAAPDDPQVLEALGGRVSDAAAVIMTHDHELDERALTWALEQGFGFVGGVGSRGKAARLRSKWAQSGLVEADASPVHMPLGLDIGARSPAEIAIAIAGELVAWRAGKQGTGRDRDE